MSNRNYVKAIKTERDGILFDSGEESEYYTLLKTDPNVKNITCHPEFTLVQPFRVRCGQCYGDKTVPSPKTGNPIKCRRCDGEGTKERKPMRYTADFMVEYLDGNTDFIDVKGWANESFPLRKKLFEQQMGVELIVMTKKKGKWVRK
jgi:hypothetical protein